MIEGLNNLGQANVPTNSGTLGSGTSQSAQAQKDQFLKLLTYQLRSQNPLKPYDNQEFASQLAQFSQLEQLTDIRAMMEEQSKSNFVLSQTMQNSALPGMLGKTAKVITNHVALNSEDNVKLGFNSKYPATQGQISIYNGNGQIVRTVDLSSDDFRSGDNTYEWDGKDQNGDRLPSGTYTYYADFAGSNGSEFTGETFMQGSIEAVRFKSEGTMLVVGGLEVPLQDVLDIAN